MDEILDPLEAVLHIYRVFYNDAHEPLMVQEIVSKEAHLTYYRNLVWEREVWYEKVFDQDGECL